VIVARQLQRADMLKGREPAPGPVAEVEAAALIAEAWHWLIGHLDYASARAAVEGYYEQSVIPMQPADVLERSKP
jgi:hypothetical protein